MSTTETNRFARLSRREACHIILASAVGAALAGCSRAKQPGQQMEAALDGMTPERWALAPVTAIAQAIRNGVISSEDLTLAYLQRIDVINPIINALVHVSGEQALLNARRADAKLAAGEAVGPLHGVPMTLKDSIDTAGMVTTYGTKGRQTFVPSRDATVTSRLRAAGAILLGKSNTPEFTLSFETDNLVHGRTSNPFDTARSPGGSSGGAAAAVTAGLTAFDIGSDTGGSIRVPSHFCGTAGLKPTQGRVPRTGHAVSFGGLHDPLTQLGPIARTVDDLELVLGVISGPDGHDPFVAPVPLRSSCDVTLDTLRVGWHADNGIYAPTPDITAVVASAANSLGNKVASLREVVPDPVAVSYETLSALFVWNEDGGAWIRRLLEAAGTDQAHPAIAVQIDPERLVESGKLTRMIEARDHFRSEMLAFMQDYDALVTPTAGFPATLFGETEADANFPGFSYTQIYNLCGFPAVVTRCGTSPDGLPIGVQVAARPWREDIALAVARYLEKEFGGWQAPMLET